MRLHELLAESVMDVVRTAQTLANQYGLKVTVTAEGPTELQLVWIERTTGNKGNGARFLTDLVRLADQHGIAIMLAVHGGEAKLIQLYQRFGFHISDPGGEGEDPIMERPAQSLR